MLFDGQELFQQTFLDAVGRAPADRDPARGRRRRPASTPPRSSPTSDAPTPGAARPSSPPTPALQERELLKLTGLGEAWAEALRARGVTDPDASLAARLGVTVFTVAYAQWLTDPTERSLAEIQDEVLGQLRALTAS